MSSRAVTLPTAVVSHLSAAALWGVDVEPPAIPQLTVPHGYHHKGRPGLHRSDLAPSEIVIREGVAVTRPLRTARDCAVTLDAITAVIVLDGLLRLHRVTAAALAQCAASARGPGSSRFRLAVGRTAASGSGLETRARLLFVAAGLAVVPQFRFAGWSHAYDFAIPHARILIEIEGFGFHRTRAELDRDARHANEAALAGWTLLRFTWEDVRHRPEQMVATVLAAVARAGW